MKTRLAFSFVEALVVVAVIGVLASIGFFSLPRDRFAVNQSVDEVARTLEKARFDAIRLNREVVVDIDLDADTIDVTADVGATTIADIAFGTGDLAQLGISSTLVSPIRVTVDARGVGMVIENGSPLAPSTGGVGDLTIQHTGSGFARTLSFNRYLRTEAP